MILVDTSVWIDHLRRGDAQLAALLERGVVVMHPFVLGEVSCGSLADRSTVLEPLQNLPAAIAADNDEAFRFIGHHALHGTGIGFIDVHLLASVMLTHGAKLWTRDKRLKAAAHDFDCAHTDASAH